MPINDGQSGRLGKLQPYSQAYIEKCFVAWYSAGCPTKEMFNKILPVDEYGRIPHPDVVKKFMEMYDWRARADLLNVEVAKQIEQRAVEVRVEMLNRQAELGKELQQKGIDYLREHEFEKAGEALKAVISGAELEKASRGLPDSILQVAKMKDDDLLTTLNTLLGKASASGDLEKALGFDVETEFKEAIVDEDAASPE